MTDEQKQVQQTQLKQEVARQVQSYQVQNPSATQTQLADYIHAKGNYGLNFINDEKLT